MSNYNKQTNNNGITYNETVNIIKNEKSNGYFPPEQNYFYQTPNYPQPQNINQFYDHALYTNVDNWNNRNLNTQAPRRPWSSEEDKAILELVNV